MTVVRSKYAPRPNDLYETPEWVTRALIRKFSVAGRSVWEPAAGNHKIADVLTSAGATVITSDVATYSREHVFEGVDFFADDVPPIKTDCLITNPPYGAGNRLAARFARLALQRCAGVVALLLTAKFDFGSTRRDLFADNSRFICKIALVDRIQWFAGEHEGTEDHAWYVWDRRVDHFVKRQTWLEYAGRDD